MGNNISPINEPSTPSVTTPDTGAHTSEMKTAPSQPPLPPHTTLRRKLIIMVIVGILLLILVVVGLAYVMNGNTIRNENIATDKKTLATISPAISGSTSKTPIKKVTNWKKYNGKYVSFDYPPQWSPEKLPACCGSELEVINPGIPGAFDDQVIEFTGVELDNIKVPDAIQKSEITIGGKKGFKWLRKGQGYFAYSYMTTGYNGQGSFGVTINVAQEDKGVEAMLDKLVASIAFK